jgi:DNA-binding SARP family transcriptional activator/Tfp pilus assembly protein PilF
MIRFFTLGGLDLRDSEDRELRPVLTQAKRAVLLAYLALADSSGFRRRDTIVSMFWPESDDSHARAALRQGVRFLRRAIGDDVVVSRGEEEIGIDGRKMWLDGTAFERAAQEGRHAEALELYRGPFLDGVHVSDASPELAHWMEATRARYSRLAAATAWSAAESHRQQGDHVAASKFAHRGYETSPDDEASLRRLVSFLDNSGDRSGALATYEAFARRLNDDGDMEPAPETIAVAQAIRARTTRSPEFFSPADAPAAPIVDTKPAAPAQRVFLSRRTASLGGALVLLAIIGVAVAEGSRTDTRSPAAAASPTALSSEKARNPRATNEYVQGRYWWNKRGPGLLKSIGFFSRALDADPTFAEAYSGIGDAYVQLGYASALAPADAFPKARAAAQRALDLDSTLAEPHATLAFVHMYYDWDWMGTEREFRRAIELDSTYATAYEWYGLFLAAMGRFDEANAREREAQRLDALSIAVAGTAAWVDYYSGHDDAAKTELRIILREDSAFWLGHFYLGRVEEAAGDYDRALAEYGATGPLREWVPTLAAKGHLLGAMNRRAEAEVILARLDSMSRRQYVTAYGVALVYEALGDRDRAFAALERGVQERTHWMVWLNRDPRWRSLRGDPRFASLVKEVGLPD